MTQVPPRCAASQAGQTGLGHQELWRPTVTRTSTRVSAALALRGEAVQLLSHPIGKVSNVCWPPQRTACLLAIGGPVLPAPLVVLPWLTAPTATGPPGGPLR
jgi:hypothetical protein